MANNPKKYAGESALSALVTKIKELFVSKTDFNSSLSNKADKSHTHSISDTTNLQSTLDGKVPTSRTINSKPLTANVTLSASDVGAAPSAHDHDGRYYTETEIDQKLSGKSDKTHNHDSSYAAKDHSHDDYALSEVLDDHTSNSDIHFTAAERTKLSGIAAGAQVNTITGVKGNSESSYRTGNVNITKANIGLGNVDNTSDANKPISTAQQTAFDEVNDAIDTHTENDDIHVTTTNKSNWNTAYNHSQAAHARTDATKVEDSSTNGNIKINGTETNVYSHPTSGVTAGTYKSVTVNAQGHVTSGSNPTTLSGFGITDGALKSDVTNHNTSTSAHSDIRELITGLTTRLNTLANSDDTTLDQMSEIVAYIKSNKALIDGITTNKVNVADIINNLTTNVTNKPLSAAQGVEIKRLIDALDSALDTHDGNTTKHITSTERTNWNAAKTHADSAHAPSNAEKNQNAFSNVKVGSTTIAADTTTDTLELVGSNVTITPDATNDKVTIAVADATTSAKGVVQLTDSVTSTSTTTAATPKNVKAAYDLANTAKTTADGKQAAITGGASTITSSNLTASRALVSNSSGKVAVSAVTSTELGYLDGVTSNVQTQLDSKLSTSGGTISGIITTTDGDVVNRNNATSGTYFYGGTDFNDGAFLGLYGKDQSNYSGQFRLKAEDGENFVYLEGRPDGTLKWGGKDILRSDSDISFTNRAIYGKLPVANGGTGLMGVTYNNFLVGNGNSTLIQKTPAEVLSMINGASVATLTTEEYTALEQAQETNANTLYMITDAEEEVVPQIQFITWEEND